MSAEDDHSTMSSGQSQHHTNYNDHVITDDHDETAQASESKSDIDTFGCLYSEGGPILQAASYNIPTITNVDANASSCRSLGGGYEIPDNNYWDSVNETVGVSTQTFPRQSQFQLLNTESETAVIQH